MPNDTTILSANAVLAQQLDAQAATRASMLQRTLVSESTNWEAAQ
jgi:hypothetical protein